MNLRNINTADAQNLKEDVKTWNINDVKTMIVKTYTAKGTAALVRYTIAFRELRRRGWTFQYTPNCFNFMERK